MNKIEWFSVGVFLLLLSQLVSGFYEGQTIKLSFNVYTDDGKDDADASLDDSFILDPDDNYAGKKTFSLSEEDVTNLPGVWTGTYTIPASPAYGMWRAIGRLTNVNGTNGTDIISFFVTDKPATEANVSQISGMTSEQNATLYNISNEINEPFDATESKKGFINRLIYHLLQELQGILGW